MQQQQQQQDGSLKRRRWDEDKDPPLPSTGAGPSSSSGGSLLRSEGSAGSRGSGLDGRPLSRNGRAASSPETLEKVRRALTVGFSNRIARRMRLHNGYRTCNQKGALAQVRAVSCVQFAGLVVDQDYGMVVSKLVLLLLASEICMQVHPAHAHQCVILPQAPKNPGALLVC
jgi:hypothetical protein